MITIKNESQIEKMRNAGALLHEVLEALRREIEPGVTTLHLDQMAERLIRQAGAPSEAKLQTSNSIHSENEIIRRAQQYISSHVRDKLTVPVVAANVEVSASYLTALFHKNLQLSPGEYIRRVKLQESKQLIREGQMNFTEISEFLQYSTVHHFSRQFKQMFGMTPTEYRLCCIKKQDSDA